MRTLAVLGLEPGGNGLDVRIGLDLPGDARRTVAVRPLRAVPPGMQDTAQHFLGREGVFGEWGRVVEHGVYSDMLDVIQTKWLRFWPRLHRRCAAVPFP